MQFPISETLKGILDGTPELRQAYLVGGCVRDALLGLPTKDVDVEVFGVSYEDLGQALSRWGRTDFVGRSFGVVKLTPPGGPTHDFAIPRRDRKTRPGHRGFEIAFDPGITPREAAARRDFTINALMLDPRSGEVLDFFGGQADLQNRVLRHTSAAFVDDPLRVLRGMQFVARFELRPAEETVVLCRSIKSTFGELAAERVCAEWLKWARGSAKPSLGLRLLVDTEWIEHFPEIQALTATPQDPEWHPEGDVFTHTCHCCDALARLPQWRESDPESRAVSMLAVLAHDFGKPPTTQKAVKDGRKRIVSPGHEEAGVPLAESFLRRMRAPQAIEARVTPLVASHLAHLQPITDRSVRRLARRLHPETIEGLCLVLAADHAGRPPLPADPPASIAALLERAAQLAVQDRAPRPLLMGRHLVALGLEPGRDFHTILEAAFDAQLDGRFGDVEGGLRWLQQQSELPLTAAARAALALRCPPCARPES